LVDLCALRKNYTLNIEGYQLINYSNLTKKDSLVVLAMRNDLSIRSRMVNSDLISEENHYKYISQLPKKNMGYWALKKNDIILGSISLVEYNEDDDSFLGGNYIDPEMIGSGKGAVINHFMHYIAFEVVKCTKIRAIVQKDNVNAIRVNQLFGAVFLEKAFKEEKMNSDYITIEFLANNWINSIKDKTRKIIEYAL
tara:strand:+ start:4552 stop:5139 length:588 start_codon:yes stop_codon:yes gene_type:complete